MNKQPFYVSVEASFTATRDISSEEVKEALAKILDVIPDTVVIEEVVSEAGDPADLL